MHFEDAINFLNRISVRVVNDLTDSVHYKHGSARITSRRHRDFYGVYQRDSTKAVCDVRVVNDLTAGVAAVVTARLDPDDTGEDMSANMAASQSITTNMPMSAETLTNLTNHFAGIVGTQMTDVIERMHAIRAAQLTNQINDVVGIQMTDVIQRMQTIEGRIDLLASGSETVAPESNKRKRYVAPYWTRANHPELPHNVFFRNKHFRWKRVYKGRLVECKYGFNTMDEALASLNVFNDTEQDNSVSVDVVPDTTHLDDSVAYKPYTTKKDNPDIPTNVFFRNKLFRWKKMKARRITESKQGFETLEEACESLKRFVETGQQ